MPIPFYKPAPAPPGVFENTQLPLYEASLFSRFAYQWVAPILKVGFSRPLEADDLWELPPEMDCELVADKLEAQFNRRIPPSKRPQQANHYHTDAQVRDDDVSDSETLVTETTPLIGRTKTPGRKKAERIARGDIAIEDGMQYDMSLWKAIFLAGRREWFISMVFLYIAYGLRMAAPLLTKILIDQLKLANDVRDAQARGDSTDHLERPRSMGFDVAIGIACGMIQMMAGGSSSQARHTAAVLSCKTRAALVSLISRKSMRLSGKARIEMSNGRINTMMSADTAYVDRVLASSPELPVAPVTILVGIGLLWRLIGPSALVGLGVLVLAAASQSTVELPYLNESSLMCYIGILLKRLFALRRSQTKLVDERVRLLAEVIDNIRAVKLYAYEDHFAKKVSSIRGEEHAKLRKNVAIDSAVKAIFIFTPVLATILTFVTYALLGHELQPGTIFAALQTFGVIKFPIGRFPDLVSSFVDALSAVRRLRDMLIAEELQEHIDIDHNAPFALSVHGSFQYDSIALAQREPKAIQKPQATSFWKKSRRQPSSALPDMDDQEVVEASTPFALRDLNLDIPQGALVCIVGRVGTGKSALLSGLINEMKRTSGYVKFGGDVSYVPQQAWVQSGTVRDNITFGSDSNCVDVQRVNDVIDACGLRPDVDMWPGQDLTRIGERGITLSGGQRQRLCIARAAYQDSSVVLLDDPLSAVDAHVGLHLLNRCFLNGPLAQRTRILVTHHLDVLPRADLILVMDRNEDNEGRVIQQGTYNDLVQTEGVFQTLIEDFGTVSSPSRSEETGGKVAPLEKGKALAVGEKAGKLILDEERNLGDVPLYVYLAYLRAIGSWTMIGLTMALYVLQQCSMVADTLVLGFWSARTFPGLTPGQYMAVYGAVGGSIAILRWATRAFTCIICLRSSYTLFNDAWQHVIRSPTTWHDRTPTGRIISRLSKDIQMLDDRLPVMAYIMFSDILTAVGVLGLLLYTLPWLGFSFIPLILFTYIVSVYYRQTSREIKRLDSLLRSHVYSSFAEQLAGLPVIRAFNQQRVFQHRLQLRLNDQNRAYVLSVSTQRWIFLRLDIATCSIVALVGVAGSIYRDQVDATRVAVCLTYSIVAAMSLGLLATAFSDFEVEMNNVERLHYYTQLEMEAAPRLESDPQPEAWPTHGEVTLDQVELRYRPDLPLVLKGISFTVKPGEKVGIIGRTGAGKSSIGQALFRAVEPCGGSIAVDGVDLQSLGLETLRSRLSIIPQDAFLFAGSVRDNLDPLGAKSDADLNEALNLITGNSKISQSMREKFRLDAAVLADGANFSAGEKQLLALLRALLRNCKVLLLDEATSSVDPETDAIMQKIIQTEFSHVTLMSIAHRLQTVAYYDRILVLDAGQVAEYDTPLALYDTPGSIFRNLCDAKDLHREELLRIRADAAAATGTLLADH